MNSTRTITNYLEGEYATARYLLFNPKEALNSLKMALEDNISPTSIGFIIREGIWCAQNGVIPDIGQIEEGLRCRIDKAGDENEVINLHRAEELLEELQKGTYDVNTTQQALEYIKSLERKLFALTDSGNAELFVEQHRHQIRFCPELGGWHVFQEGRWQRDHSGLVHQMAKQTVRSRYGEAANEPDTKKLNEIVAWAKKSESRMKRKDMLELAQNEPGIHIQVSDFDTHPYLFNCANGTIDLKTGVIRPHDAGDLLTQISPVVYDPQAQCPRWQKFLSDIFAGEGKAEVIDFIRRFTGHILTGDTREQCFFIGWGVGSNGKSTLLQVIRWLLGDYAAHAKTDTFTVKRNEGVNNDLARLRSARFVSAVETDEGKRLAEALIKEITGGDPVTARFLFKEYFEYPPQYKVFLATNHKPEIRGTDNGIWRRVRLIPFEVKFWNAEASESGEPHLRADKTLLEKLREELPGILAWAVQGCLEWQQSGLSAPEVVVAATTRYREEQDVLSQFIEDCCHLDSCFRVTAKALNDEYRAWCERNGEKPMTKTALGRRLNERGFVRGDTANARGWKGIGLMAPDLEASNRMVSSVPMTSSAPMTGYDMIVSKLSYKNGYDSSST